MTVHAFVSSALYFGREIQGQFVVASKDPKDSECKRDFFLRVIHPDTGKEFGMHVFAKDVIFKDENAKTIELGFGRVIPKDGQTVISKPAEPVIELTDDELDLIIYKRFEIMNMLSDSLIQGNIRSLIISGAPGISKTYSLEHKLDVALEDGTIQSFTHLKGRITPLQLFVKLFENKDKGQVLLIDDVNVWGEENSVEILKAALDTGAKREITWASTLKWLEENEIPQTFEFNGSVCFITNMDFDREIAKNNSSSIHLKALISRANYLDLKVHTNREILIRIKQVIRDSSILESNGLNAEQGILMVKWLETNVERLREVSLRTVLKIASYMNTSEEEWDTIASVMLLKK